MKRIVPTLLLLCAALAGCTMAGGYGAESWRIYRNYFSWLLREDGASAR